MAVNNRTATTTQIRNMYSEGMSYLNISFYNNSLSLKFSPFINNGNGRSKYDTNNSQTTTLNYDLTYALYSACKDILDCKVSSSNLSLPCNGGTLVFNHQSTTESMETILTLNKNNISIPFRFQTINEQVTIDGQQQTKIIPAGVGVFMMTLEGFLTGINADRHLDKLTEDYIKAQQNSQNNNQNNYNKGNYNNKKNYRNYNNSNSNNQTPVQTQDMSTYNIPFN